MRQRITGVGIGIILLLLGCKQDDLPFYNGDKAIVMVKPWAGDVAYSYTRDGRLADTGVRLAIPVLMIGGNELDSAVHYTVRYESDALGIIGYPGKNVMRVDAAFDSGVIIDTLDIDFARDTAYMDTVYTLHISLETPVGYDTPLVGSETLEVARTWVVRIGDRFEEPAWWAGYENYLGAFSSRKMRVIAHWIGWAYDYSVSIPGWLQTRVSQDPMGFGRSFRQFLAQRASAGNPIRERNGEAMRAGALVYD